MVPFLATLPAQCPERRCGVLLQVDLHRGMTVAPHYNTCHPDTYPPKVRNGV